MKGIPQIYVLFLIPLLISCASKTAELEGTWISSYSISQEFDNPDSEPYYSGSSWRMLKITDSQITIRQFRHHVAGVRDFEETSSYRYSEGKILINTRFGIDTIYLESVTKDSLTVSFTRLYPGKEVFKRVHSQTSIKPVIRPGVYVVSFLTRRDTLVVLDDQKLMHINESEHWDGLMNYWHVAEFDAVFLLNVEMQFGENLVIESQQGDTLNLKLYSMQITEGRMVPVTAPAIVDNLIGKWRQITQAETPVFFPFLQMDGGFNANDSVAVLQVSEDQLTLRYGGKTGTWPLDNRAVNNVVIFESQQTEYRWNCWRIYRINEEEIAIQFYSDENTFFYNLNPIHFKRVAD